MGCKKPTIDPGNRYAKEDAPNTMLVAGQPLNVADAVSHVRHVQEVTTNREITLSISALMNTSIYKKIEAKPQAG